MHSEDVERILREISCSAVLCKLNGLAKDLSGLGLLVVWSCGDTHGQLAVCGCDRELPEFCRLLHEAPQGLRRCVTCHSLLALAARNRSQVIQGRCHGGACVVAAPAAGLGLSPGIDVVVVSSCAFTMPDRRQGWRVTRQLARDLGIDLGKLRRAYAELPHVRGGRMKIVGEIVDAAAAAIADLWRGRAETRPDAGAETPSGAAEARLRAALRASREVPFRHAVGSPRATVVDVVLSVVGANPQLPVTVADIARAAHMSPNHFSLIFHRQTGRPFKEFLTETRLARAQERLADLTLSIREVAEQSGFPDANYFAKVFRKHTGMSPRAWRYPKARRR